jgi:MYXO-CTERM domain-containing protein
MLRIHAAPAVLATLAIAGLAQAAVVNNTSLSIPFTPGSGNSNTNFVVSTQTESNSNVVELGIKGKQRFFGDTLPITGNVYEAQPGFSATSSSNPALDPTRAWWNFDYSANLGTRSTNDTIVTISIQDIQGDIASFDITAATLPTGSPALSVIQNSWNIGFAFLSTPLAGFDPSLPGDYTLTISARDLNTNAGLGSATAIVRVVPTPGAAALLGMGGLLAMRRRR